MSDTACYRVFQACMSYVQLCSAASQRHLYTVAVAWLSAHTSRYIWTLLMVVCSWCAGAAKEAGSQVQDVMHRLGINSVEDLAKVGVCVCVHVCILVRVRVYLCVLCMCVQEYIGQATKPPAVLRLTYHFELCWFVLLTTMCAGSATVCATAENHSHSSHWHIRPCARYLRSLWCAGPAEHQHTAPARAEGTNSSIRSSRGRKHV